MFNLDARNNYKFEEKLLLDLICFENSRDYSNDLAKEFIVKKFNHIIDWNFFNLLLEEHDLAPYIQNSLISDFRDYLPSEILINYKKELRTNQENSFLTAGHIALINKKFNQANLQIISFKGPVLCKQLYNNFYSRKSCDLDFFVEEGNIFEVINILAELGFMPLQKLSLPELENYIKKEAELIFHNSETNLFLELHWRMLPKYMNGGVDIESCFERSYIANLDGLTSRVFSNEDLVILLSIHASKHRFDKLKWISDIDLLLKKNPKLDWNYIIQKAKNWRAQRILFLSLSCSNYLFNTQIPKKILESNSFINSKVYIQKYLEKSFWFYRGVVGKKREYYYQTSFRESKIDKSIYFLGLGEKALKKMFRI